MNFEDARFKSREIARKYAKQIERELSEECVSGNVASVLSFVLSQALDNTANYFQLQNICSQGQYLRALEVILRNKARMVAEQLEAFAQVPEGPRA